MTIHIVMISHSLGRYADSYWVDPARADKRRDDLDRNGQQFGFKCQVWVCQAELQDAELGRTSATEAPNESR